MSTGPWSLAPDGFSRELSASKPAGTFGSLATPDAEAVEGVLFLGRPLPPPLSRGTGVAAPGPTAAGPARPCRSAGCAPSYPGRRRLEDAVERSRFVHRWATSIVACSGRPSRTNSRDAVLGVQASQGIQERRVLVQVVLAQFQNYIARPQPRGIGRAAANDSLDQRPVVNGQLVLRLNVRIDVQVVDADVRPRIGALTDDRLNDRLDGLGSKSRKRFRRRCRCRQRGAPRLSSGPPPAPACSAAGRRSCRC